MEVKHREEATKGMFYIEKGALELAKMTYSKAGETSIIIDHTEVDPELKGQGAGKKLVEKAVAFAREKQVKIIPLCPFAKATFEKNAEWQDVL